MTTSDRPIIQEYARHSSWCRTKHQDHSDGSHDGPYWSIETLDTPRTGFAVVEVGCGTSGSDETPSVTVNAPCVALTATQAREAAERLQRAAAWLATAEADRRGCSAVNGTVTHPAMSAALTRLEQAAAGLDLTDEQQHHLAWLRGWGPGVLGSIAGVIEQARAVADELEGQR